MEPAELAVEGRPIAVTFRRNAKARRLILRLSRDRSGVVVTLPPRVGRSEALDFVKKSAKWISQHLAAEPKALALQAGTQIPIRGETLEIAPAGTRRWTTTTPCTSRPTTWATTAAFRPKTSANSRAS